MSSNFEPHRLFIRLYRMLESIHIQPFIHGLSLAALICLKLNDIFWQMKGYAFTDNFASAAETRNYLHNAASKFGVWEHCTFDTDVTGANWNEESSKWHVQTKSRKTGKTEDIVSNVLWSAAGLFATPNLPKIDGLDKTKVVHFHTANWDHSVDWKGKDVALIGNGSVSLLSYRFMN